MDVISRMIERVVRPCDDLPLPGLLLGMVGFEAYFGFIVFTFWFRWVCVEMGLGLEGLGFRQAWAWVQMGLGLDKFGLR